MKIKRRLPRFSLRWSIRAPWNAATSRRELISGLEDLIERRRFSVGALIGIARWNVYVWFALWLPLIAGWYLGLLNEPLAQELAPAMCASIVTGTLIAVVAYRGRVRADRLLLSGNGVIHAMGGERAFPTGYLRNLRDAAAADEDDQWCLLVSLRSIRFENSVERAVAEADEQLDAWFHAQLAALPNSQREIVEALFGEFDGALGELLEAARKL